MAAGREDEPKGRLELYRRLGGPDAGRGARRLPPIRPADDRAADAAPGPAATDVLPRGRRPPAPRHRLARGGARPARLLVGQPLAGLRPRWSLHRPPRRDRSRSLYRVEAWREPLVFEIPAAPSGRRWRRPWTPPCPRPMTPSA